MKLRCWSLEKPSLPSFAIVCVISIEVIALFCFHFRYVHNNIFFSFAVDADLEQLSRKHPPDTNLMTENISEKTTDKLSQGVTRLNEDKSSGSNTEDLVLELPTDVPPETQLAESEQATYASANNDLKGTKSYQEADVPGLYNLAMAIIDYRGHRVVAQVCN